MTKLVRCGKLNVALITILGVAFIISLLLLIFSSRYLINMLRSSPAPIDSFGSIDLGITLVVIFSVLLITSAIGIVIGILKLKIH